MARPGMLLTSMVHGLPGVLASSLCRALPVVLGLLVGLSGCSRKIGDSCKYSTDCSVAGDRLCDITQAGGYCTIGGCEPDGCPSGESACVAFTEPSCPNLPTSIRFSRNFCMATCSDNGDCRDGYQCVEKGMYVVDSNPESRKVCLAKSSTLVSSGSSNGSAAVCQPSQIVLETEPAEAGLSSDAAFAADLSEDASSDAGNAAGGGDGAATEGGGDGAATEGGGDGAATEGGGDGAATEGGGDGAATSG